VVKGIATNGWQINVTRTADQAVREIKRIAEGFIGELNDEPNRDLDLSGNGLRVAFTTGATNIDARDASPDADVYVKNLASGAIEQASVATGGGQATGTNGDTVVGGDSTISADGRFIAFWSAATNLVSGDSNGFNDVFVRDRVAGTTIRVTSSGVQGNEHSYSPALSLDGRFVAFDSKATSLATGGGSGQDLFVYVNY